MLSDKDKDEKGNQTTSWNDGDDSNDIEPLYKECHYPACPCSSRCWANDS